MHSTPPGKSGKPSRRIRLDDLATACGVSIATVSRALSGAPGVRPELVEKIQRKAQEFRYALPSTLSGQRLLILASPAAMEDYARSQFTLNVMQGIEEQAKLLRAAVMTQPITSTEQERQTLAEVANDPSVAGLLFLTLDDEDMLTAARASRKPVVLVNGDDPLMQLSSVAPSNRAAATMATDYLMRLGHRRILFLSRRGRRTIERRFEGWRDRMTLGGVALDAGLQIDVADWLPDCAAQAVKDRIQRHGVDFSAVLCASDSLAMGCMQGLASLGLSVPGDVSVLGMDGLAQGAFFTPPLTAIEMPMRHIGAAAVDLLRDLSFGAHMPARRIELACRLIERQSCGPVKASP
ncbi:MAG: LacI family DNA-binding transcriptional regulator [Pseudotabrizicola sp.]|uniref:LacI family DNA-binding transcriptional regulator n=1 Tax=Pseudotabrizicola sp. TaxID=2939647 RepID=UPI00271E5218|nr:LacI family DNA-binding transcriptional regulator [Pseudotabrizicola sp.]MDO8882542.1 LacI family DNA-binding transcriptional regulator [Pseudotabrizicola sp.]MDP2081393.1 LacI family DNA-binding transcriptional regulator [Pseudotabrizicola sp.]MDZ7572906.1 LacI family DNA-binding transcriptional regulator [Pseudotabrizicola sp.]